MSVSRTKSNWKLCKYTVKSLGPQYFLHLCPWQQEIFFCSELYLENYIKLAVLFTTLNMYYFCLSAEFVAHSSSVNCLALTPNNGRMLATGGDDRRINLWLIGQPNNIMVQTEAINT